MKPTISMIHTSKGTVNVPQKLCIILYRTILYCYIFAVLTNHDTFHCNFYTNAFTTTAYPYHAPKLHSNDFTQVSPTPMRVPVSTTKLHLLPKSTSATLSVCNTNSLQSYLQQTLPRRNTKMEHKLPFDHHLQQRDSGKSITSVTALYSSLLPIVASTSSSSSIFGVALISAISGGIFSGGLHAIAGPDHLAALLPRCIGQRWHRSIRVGAIWGIGHGISATILGCIAFLIKRTVISSEYVFRSSATTTHLNPLSKLMKVCLQFITSKGSNVMEIAVGVSLIVIGIIGIREARDFTYEYDEPVTAPPTLNNLSAAVNVALTDTDQSLDTNHDKSSTTAPSLRIRAILLNGILHGFSWDGAPSLAPALALMTWCHTITFLSSYAFGTMITMAFVTTLIGEGTRQASQIFQRPDLPQKFSFASSILAIAIGIVWCGLGLR